MIELLETLHTMDPDRFVWLGMIAIGAFWALVEVLL